MKVEKKELSKGDKIAKAMKSKAGRIILFITFSAFLCSLNNPLAGKILGVIFTWVWVFFCF